MSNVQTINCYVPLKLRLRGEPGEDDWATLEEVLVAKYASMLKRSVAELTKSQFVKAEMLEDVREPFAPERVATEGYWIPGYDNGKKRQVPLVQSHAEKIKLLRLLLQKQQKLNELRARLDAIPRFCVNQEQCEITESGEPVDPSELESLARQILALRKEIEELLNRL